MGKHVALHTHFNHANEITWVTREAMQVFNSEGVTVRNQSVLLHGVNDTVQSMAALIREVADIGIIPVRPSFHAPSHTPLFLVELTDLQ
jgi:lysine 2,3-aminomutase